MICKLNLFMGNFYFLFYMILVGLNVKMLIYCIEIWFKLVIMLGR